MGFDGTQMIHIKVNKDGSTVQIAQLASKENLNLN